MPCYEVNTMTLASFNLKSKEILVSVLKEMGFNVNEYRPEVIMAGSFTFDLNKMKVEYPERRYDTFLRIKNLYSRKVIELAAKKKNWILKQISENKYKATKF